MISTSIGTHLSLSTVSSDNISRRRLGVVLALNLIAPRLLARDTAPAKQRAVRSPGNNIFQLIDRTFQIMNENAQSPGVQSLVAFYRNTKLQDSSELRTAGSALLLQGERDLGAMDSPISDARIRSLLSVQWDVSRYNLHYAEVVAADARQRMACDLTYADAMAAAETQLPRRTCLLPGGVEVPYWVCVVVVVVIIGSAGLLLIP